NMCEVVIEKLMEYDPIMFKVGDKYKKAEGEEITPKNIELEGEVGTKVIHKNNERFHSNV
ncbi:hypothetical protein Ancab_031603, partial [Ancistrocladus abbreviatus]